MSKQRSGAPVQDPNGTWAIVVDPGPGINAKVAWRRRRQARRRGFPTRKAAQVAKDELRVSARHATLVAHQRQTVREFRQDDWLPAVRGQLARSSIDSYEPNIRHHIIPAVRSIQLLRLLDETARDGTADGTPRAGTGAKTPRARTSATKR